MAASRIKGITIEIGGDTTKLVQALSKVDNALNKTKTNLRDINKALKLDPTNTELLKDRQNELSRAIAETKQRLDAEREAYEQLSRADSTPQNVEKMRQLKTQIDLDTAALKDLENQARQAASVLGTQMQAAGQKLQEVGDKIKNIGDKISSLGQSMTQKVTVPIVTAFGASVKAATDWETAFVGVQKTVDATAEEYDQLAKNIKKMATETASSKEQIAGVMEIAGQLGIEGVDNLTEFTKVMVELGDTTNLTAEDAATALARFMNITGESTDKVDRIGSAIVDLGNNFATTESEIVEMSTRLASAGTIAGMSSTDILALAAAMSSVGINAEAGGTAMSQVLKKMANAVADFKDGQVDDLEVIASVSKMSARDFARAWEDRPVEAMQAFIKGLSGIKDEGDNVFSVLSEMGMEGIRQTNMLQSLALASDMLTDAIHTSSEAYKENSALSEEAEKRYATMAAKISQLKERFKDVAISIGEILMPYIEKLITFLEGLIEKWNALSPAQQEFIIKIAAVAAAIGPVLMIVGKLVSVIGAIISGIGSVINIIGVLMPVLAGLGGPIGLIIAAVAALTAAFIYFYQTNDEFRDRVNGAIQSVQEIFGLFVEKIREWLTLILEWLAPVIESISYYLQSVWELVRVILDLISKAITSFLNKHKTEINAFLITLKATIKAALDVITIGLKTSLNALKIVFTTFFGVLGDLVKAFTALLKGDWQSALSYIESAAKRATSMTQRLFENMRDGVKDLFSDLIDDFREWGEDMVNNLVEGIKSKIGSVKSPMRNLASTIRSYIHFTEPDIGPLSDFHTYMPDMINTLVSGIEKGIPQIQGAMNNMTSAMVPNMATPTNAMTNNNNNVNITVYGAQGQDVSELADIIQERINAQVYSREAVFA